MNRALFLLGRLLLVTICIIGFLNAILVSTIEASDSPNISLGKQIYQQGIGASGEPLIVKVAGDLPIPGAQFNCQSCHGRSGMGASEGNYIVPPIRANFLYDFSVHTKRPPYDRKSLVRVLRDGVDTEGRILDPMMPRFELTDIEAEALASYLEELAAKQSPGVDSKVIRMATVVSDDVDPDKRDAILEVIQLYVKQKNSQTRLESARYNRGLTPESKLPTLYRKWEHEVWTLTGPREGWRKQLEKYYNDNPIYAMVGGFVSGSWAPISTFCENLEIPCIFPNTVLPEAKESDFYTLYFSRGLELEADLITKHLLVEDPPLNVIQAYCSETYSRMAGRVRSTLSNKGIKVTDLKFSCSDPFPETELKSMLTKNPRAAVVLWLSRDKLVALNKAKPARFYVSSTLLDSDFEGIQVAESGKLFAAHPYRLTGKIDSAFMRFKVWAKLRKIKLRYPRLQAEAFFASLATKEGLKHTRRYLIREYLLEMLDHSQGLSLYLPIYSLPTFGPGQRFLNKGGYVLPIINGKAETKGASLISP